MLFLQFAKWNQTNIFLYCSLFFKFFSNLLNHSDSSKKSIYLPRGQSQETTHGEDGEVKNTTVC